MIKDLLELKTRGGRWWFADFRFDEGIRIREDPICPTLCSNNDMRTISTSVYVIEVMEKDKVKVKNGTKQGNIDCRVGGGVVNCLPRFGNKERTSD